jgi:Ca-activated chloride channel family protein
MFVLSAIAQDLVVNVNLTMLNVVVEDQQGRPFLDLTADDFEILESGQVKPVKHFSLNREPIALGIVVDRSSSIDSVRKEMDRAAAQLLERLNPDDEALLITFAGASKVNVPLTRQHKKIVDAMRKVKRAYGTRLYDVLIDSLQYLATSPFDRKALVVFSDGADHYSSKSFADLFDVAKLYNYRIYFFGYVGTDSRTGTEKGRREIRDQFEQLATMTGGKTFFPAKNADCSRFARDIFNGVGQSYKIGFYSSEGVTLPDVSVRLRGDRVKEFRVRISTDAMPLSAITLGQESQSLSF